MEALPSVFAVAVPCADVLSAVSVGLRVAETIPCAQGCVGGGGEGFMCISDMTFSCRPWMKQQQLYLREHVACVQGLLLFAGVCRCCIEVDGCSRC